jgi:hypothetical protein
MSLPYNVGLLSDGPGPASTRAQNSGCLSTGSIAGRPARGLSINPLMPALLYWATHI